VAPRTTLAGPNVQVKPADETRAVRVRVPMNPFTGAIVTFDVPLVLAPIFSPVGLVVILKSGAATLKVTLVA